MIRVRFRASKTCLSSPVVVPLTVSRRFLCYSSYIIGIKHVFSCIDIRQVPWEVLKTEAEAHGFQHLPRDLANIYALKNHVRSLLLHTN